MIPLQPPRYEVLNARPSLTESVREFTLIEWGQWVGVTAACSAWGFTIGACFSLGRGGAWNRGGAFGRARHSLLAREVRVGRGLPHGDSVCMMLAQRAGFMPVARALSRRGLGSCQATALCPRCSARAGLLRRGCVSV